MERVVTSMLWRSDTRIMQSSGSAIHLKRALGIYGTGSCDDVREQQPVDLFGQDTKCSVTALSWNTTSHYSRVCARWPKCADIIMRVAALETPMPTATMHVQVSFASDMSRIQSYTNVSISRAAHQQQSPSMRIIEHEAVLVPDP